MKAARGFTMVELVLVVLLIGVIAAIGVPKLMGNNTMAASAFGDEVVSALRTAQKSAVARRRLVCANVGATSVTLTQAVAAGATNCTTPVNGEIYATTTQGVTAVGQALFFQPNGLITSDAAGATVARGTVTIELDGTARRAIVFEGSTGYVQ
ncbi:prepilin-type N-terminal cleavage/methylation domain-containing protein [Telluria aromaticivorans]|uniref:Prepilin-type N-terminal cleavage/methylation domain-containing protein n=1 Tax=Telluria aromaticivorans TaxID=2725995 RepID=A0A7Y2P181_9BURK|nr:prepilin-type N-terminal cleavage/methylation domain-containing protein [Telluria aromaticivorans]NNG25707.1 prepilin-type N-terminal cleavage/methylation domain-containing protein [Telluria aromaticivorans]